MSQQRSGWLWVNISIIGGCLIGAPLQLIATDPPVGFDRGSWSFPWLIAGFSLFAVFVLTSIQTLNSHAPEKWVRPSLNSSPFGFGQPLQTFYIGAFCMVAGGVGYLVTGFFETKIRWIWELPVPAGVGALLGVWLSLWAFPNRFEAR